MEVDSLNSSIAMLLSKTGRAVVDFHLEPLSASGNNRVFILYANGDKLVLKWYFHDLVDTRNRLWTEYAFLQHAWKIGLRCIPQPLEKDLDAHLALYEYVEGERLESSHITDDFMGQAAHFLATLNGSKSRTAASALPIASEACFNIHGHFALIDARLSSLNNMPLEFDIDRAALNFTKRLTSYWEEAKARLLVDCKELGLNPSAVLNKDQRILSPSDFGFHNALVRPNGKLCFFDFEYAGWDDPAKTVGDFFSHPGVAVSHEFFESFIAQALGPISKTENMANRVRILEPIFQVKWCCIVLNEFLPATARRRNFANPGVDTHARKVLQLSKAVQRFEALPH